MFSFSSNSLKQIEQSEPSTASSSHSGACYVCVYVLLIRKLQFWVVFRRKLQTLKLLHGVIKWFIHLKAFGVCVTGYLQDLVYNLSKVGKAIENNDLPAAGLVLGNGSDTEWVKTANVAFTKVHIISIYINYT